MGIADGEASGRRRKRARVRIVVAVIVVVGVVAGTIGWRPALDYVRQRRIDARVDRYAGLIEQYARANDLPVDLVRAMVRAESGGRPRVVSSKDARGLMQITDAAEQDVLRLRRWDRGDLFEPAYNLKIGTAYLRLLAERFDHDYDLAVAAYHMGAARVAALRRAHPGLSTRALLEAHANPTTRRYCRTVRGW